MKCLKCRRDYVRELDFLHDTSCWAIADNGDLSFRCGCGGPMRLRRGEMMVYAPDLSKRGLFNTLSSDKIPVFSPSVLKVKELLSRSTDDGVAEAAHLLKSEPALAAKVLALANSFRREGVGRLTSVEHAIMYAGRSRVTSLVLISAMSGFKLPTQKYTASEFLSFAVAAGFAAEAAAGHAGDGSYGPEEAYVAAAIATVGRLIQACCYPSEVDALRTLMALPGAVRSWEVVERKVQGLPSSAVLGEVGAAVWGLGGQYSSIFQGDKAQAPTAAGVTRLTLAEAVACGLAIAPTILDQPLASDAPEAVAARRRLALGPDGFQAWVIELQKQWKVRGREAEAVSTRSDAA